MDTPSLSLIGLWLRDPDWSTVLILAAFYIGAGLLMHWLSFGRPFGRITQQCRGVVPPFLTIPSILFALMTAFLGNSVVGMTRQADQAVLQEQDAAIAIIQIADIVPAAKALRPLTEAYVHAVLDSEWRRPRRFALGEAALRALTDAVVALSGDPTVGPTLQGQLLRDVRSIDAGRTTRRGIIESQTDDIPWLSVLLLGLLTQAGIAVVHLDNRKPQALALGVATTVIIVVLGLIALMERPFDGIHMVSAAPLQRMLVQDHPPVHR